MKYDLEYGDYLPFDETPMPAALKLEWTEWLDKNFDLGNYDEIGTFCPPHILKRLENNA